MIKQSRPTYICQFCTKPFTTIYSLTERPTGPPKFCHQICYHAWRDANKKPSIRKSATCHPDRPHSAHGLCQTCYGKQYSMNNREAYRKAARAYIYKKSYGLTLEDYDKLYKGQGGKCAICQESFDRLDVDHNHSTGKVRALLCPTHNKGIGMFQESIKDLEKAIEYLRFHGRN